MKRFFAIIAVSILAATVLGIDGYAAFDNNSSGAGTVTWEAQTVTSSTTVTLRSSLRSDNNHSVVVRLKGTITIKSGATLTIKMSSSDEWTQRALIQVHENFSGNSMFYVEAGGSLVIQGISNTYYVGLKGSSWGENMPTIYSNSTWTKPDVSKLSGQMRWPAGYGMITTYGNVTMTHCRMYDAYSEHDGAALVVRRNYNKTPINYGKVTLTDVRISNCVAEFGPALVIYNQCPDTGSVYESTSNSVTPASCEVSLTDCTITNNYCSGANACGVIRTGGGAYANLKLKNVSITGNYSVGTGGAVLWNAHGLTNYESVCTFDGCTISNNYAGNNGAGLSLSASFNFVNNKTTIKGNKAAAAGGGIHIPSYTGIEGLGKQTMNMRLNEYVSIQNNEANQGAGVFVDMKDTELGDGSVVNLYLEEGLNISSNTASENGGGLYYNGNSPKLYFNLYLNGGIFKSNTAVSGGGMCFVKGANMNLSHTKLYLNGGEISNCTASGSGAGVYVDGLNLQCMEKSDGHEGVKIYSNTATISGGGIYVTGGTAQMTLNGGAIYSNSCTYASSEGGGIYCDGGTLNITGGVIGGENATAANKAYNGGGIFVNNSTLIMNNGTISHNEAGQNAGGIYVKGTSVVTFNNGTISGNTSGTYGGGVYVGACDSFVMTDGVISGNSATGSNGGGAFFSTNAKNVTISGGKIINNHAENGNGGGLVVAAPVVLDGGEISGNTAQNGGGISLAFTTLTINKGAVRGNTASNNGGGIYMYDNETTDPICKFYDGEISSNVSSNHGGGIYAADGDIDIQGGEILSNTCAKNGGGINFVAVDGLLNMEGGLVKGNQSGQHGGGIYAAAGNVNFSKGVIEGNSSVQSGGGIYFSGNTFNLEEGQIINNIASWYGGGLCCTDPSDGVHSMTATISGGDVSYNEAKRCGGGIFMQFEGTLDFSGGNIIGNKAVNGGGVCLQGKADNNKGPEMTFGNGIIRNNIAKFDSSYSDDPFTTGCQMTFGWLNGVGGAIYLEEYASMKFDLTGNSLGIYANQADTMADDIFANGNGTSVVLPDVSAMDLTGYNSKTSELYWVEDYMTADTKYSSGTNGGGSGYSAKRYRDIIAEQGMVYKVGPGTYTGKYLALSVGYEVIYITLNRTGLQPGESAVYRISRIDGEMSVPYSEVLMTGAAGIQTQSKKVAVYSGTWKVEEIPWTWSYENLTSAQQRAITGSSDDAAKTFTFGGTKKTDSPLHSEDIVTNNFGTTTTTGSNINSGTISDLQNTTDYQLK